MTPAAATVSRPTPVRIVLLMQGMALFGWLAYGVGTSIGRSLLKEGAPAASGPVRTGTEEDFRRDEERFAEEERRLDEADDRRKSSR